MNIAVSACLLGEACRYDGASKACAAVTALGDVPGNRLVPVCPEVMGGLPTPRARCEIVQGSSPVRVVDEDGVDRTEAFLAGAQRALETARDAGCAVAVLKSKSPSCGRGRVYDGRFSGTLVDGDGIAARLFRRHGILVVDERHVSRAGIPTCG